MAETRAQRRLAAIVAADVAGYSRLMGIDEAGTAKALREHRVAVDPIVAQHGGRIVKTTGDGLLLEFPSVVAAVECAVAVQSLMAGRNVDVAENRQMLFRIGINLGDVLVEGDDILGDGVNIAARLEGIAAPGGICISGTAYEHVLGKISVEFVDMGEQKLKNIARAVRVYAIGELTATAEPARPTLALPDKPSIAVLPFANMSGDPEQEYFADGIVEDIITALSRFRHLFVIARNSSFTYKGRAVDVRQVGRELGVRYVLEGSVRKAGNRVRITGQLIDTGTGTHLWADRFDGPLHDIFELQDRVTTSVVGELAPQLQTAEIARAIRKPTARLDAYDHYLRGLADIYRWSRMTTDLALPQFYKAIELDPNFASAYAWAGICYNLRRQNRWMTDIDRECAEGSRLARLAVELGRDDAVPLALGGFILAFLSHELDTGAEFIDRALALNPNCAQAWNVSGWVRVYLGEHETAIEHLDRGFRLSPRDPQTTTLRTAAALAHFFAGRYEEAARSAEKAIGEVPTFVPAWRVLGASSAHAGRLDHARKAIARALELDPTQRISDFYGPFPHFPLRRSEDLASFTEGLRLAGLPE
jgi:TolB-like protein/tetratricopeptide (TPR) repeat protein